MIKNKTLRRVYEHCQYERYRARKDYNLQFYADVVESNLHNDKPKSEVLQDIMKNYSWKYPIDSLLVTETHRTHGLLHVIEHLTNLGVRTCHSDPLQKVNLVSSDLAFHFPRMD